MGSSSISSDDQNPPYEPFGGATPEGNYGDQFYYHNNKNQESQKRCEFYSRSGCRYGNECAFVHILDSQPQQQQTTSPPTAQPQQIIQTHSPSRSLQPQQQSTM